MLMHHEIFVHLCGDILLWNLYFDTSVVCRHSYQNLAPKTGFQCVMHSTMYGDYLYITRKPLKTCCKYCLYVLIINSRTCDHTVLAMNIPLS